MITSTSNTKVKRLIQLQKKHKSRDKERVFLTEGIRMFREAPVERLKEVYVSQGFYEKERALLEKTTQRAGIRYEVFSDSVFSAVSDTKTPQGVLCVVGRKEDTFEGILQNGTDAVSFLLALDHLQDPGNLGTIIRASEGAGVTGILMSGDCVDIYNPKTIRATMGSVYRMPFFYAEDFLEALTQIKQRGILVYAACLDGSRNYDLCDYTKSCAFLIGNEGNGLRDEVAKMADTYIKIPMRGQVESLNAAAAAAVLMFEVSRQRRSCFPEGSMVF